MNTNETKVRVTADISQSLTPELALRMLRHISDIAVELKELFEEKKCICDIPFLSTCIMPFNGDYELFYGGILAVYYDTRRAVVLSPDLSESDKEENLKDIDKRIKSLLWIKNECIVKDANCH